MVRIITDQQSITRYKFVDTNFEIVKNKCNKKVPILKPISSSEYKVAVLRSLNLILDCSFIQTYFNIKNKDWRLELKHCIKKVIYNKTEGL